jgi:hypothetical protein
MSHMCFQVGNEKWRCIPVQLKTLKDFLADPPPTRPWLKSTDISPEVVSDISVLASINELMKTIKTPSLQKQVAGLLHDAIPLLELPKDVRLDFDDLQGAHTLQR